MRYFNKLCILLLLGWLGQGAPAQLGEEPLMTSYTLPEDSKSTVSIENGAALYHAMGCVTCHAISGSQERKMGPTLRGVYGKNRTFMDGSKSVADDEYLRESIVYPTRRTLRGFDLQDINMPPYHEILTGPQVKSLVLFIKSLEPLMEEESDGEGKIVAMFDPPDQPFRRAPMVRSSRSIAIPLGSEVHIAFDSKRLRTHTAWKGRGLALYGPTYSNTKEPHICQVDGEVLWHNPPFFPWSVGNLPSRDPFEVLAGSDFKAIKVKGGDTVLIYQVGLPGGNAVTISEHARVERMGETDAIIRRFEIGPCEEDLWFLAHAEMGIVEDRFPMDQAIVIERTGKQYGNRLLVAARGSPGLTWEVEAGLVAYEEPFLSDENTETGKEFRKVSGHEVRAFLKVPAHEIAITIEVLSTVCSDDSLVTKALKGIGNKRLKPLSPKPAAKPKIVPSPRPVRFPPVTGDDHFRIESFSLPSEVDLLVGGMDWLSNGDLAVCTWARGEVWILENATGPVDEVRYRRFARGLMEPLGLKVVDDIIYVVQKGELTRLSDTDGDGEADLQECVNDDWGFSGNYHSYAFGPVVDGEGFFHVITCGHRSRWDVPYAGWDVRIDPISGELSGFAKGFRVPNGIGVFGPDREIFATDNQGTLIGVCKINHIEWGKSYGYRNSYPEPKELWDNPPLEKMPAVWLPYHLAPSASGITTIETDDFGPFKGQMLVGDFQFGTALRVYLEKVNGVWQGVVWPFAEGFNGPVNRLSMGPDGRLYAGGCRRTWPAAKPQEYSLDRVTYTGSMPFEVERVHALAEGFELIFTEPVDRNSAIEPRSYAVSQFNYRHHATYGSPIFNHLGEQDQETELPVSGVEVSVDGMSLALKIENLRSGFVTKVSAPAIRNSDGAELRQKTFYYTLNEKPGGVR